jgi:hypothetical protein
MALSKPTNGSNADYAARIGLLFDAVNNGNIPFPATQVASADPNVLDDYEEGTFTTGLTFGGAAVGMTKSITTGSYTKIGNRCIVSGYCKLSAKGSSTGAALFTGLPFTVNSGGVFAPASVSVATVSYTGMIHAYAVVNTTTISLRQVTEAGTDSSLTDANFGNTSDIIVQTSYQV